MKVSTFRLMLSREDGKEKQYVAWYELQTRISSPVLLRQLGNGEEDDGARYFL